MIAPLAGTVRAEIACILERFDAADQAMHRAQVQGRQGAAALAEAERDLALGERYAAGLALADLWLLLARHALEYRHEAARALLAEMLKREHRGTDARTSGL